MLIGLDNDENETKLLLAFLLKLVITSEMLWKNTLKEKTDHIHGTSESVHRKDSSVSAVCCDRNVQHRWSTCQLVLAQLSTNVVGENDSTELTLLISLTVAFAKERNVYKFYSFCMCLEAPYL